MKRNESKPVQAELTEEQEHAASVLCEQLVELADAEELNSYPSDREAVDGVLSRLCGHGVTVCFS